MYAAVREFDFFGQAGAPVANEHVEGRATRDKVRGVRTERYVTPIGANRPEETIGCLLSGAVQVHALGRPCAAVSHEDILVVVRVAEGLALAQGDGAVEVGAGTGKFTALLAGRGIRVDKEEWSWSMPSDAAGVIKRVRSVSYVAALPELEQERVDRRVRRILARHDLDREQVIAFPYVTEAYVLRRRAT